MDYPCHHPQHWVLGAGQLESPVNCVNCVPSNKLIVLYCICVNRIYIPMRGKIKEGNWVITKVSLNDN